MSGTLRDSPRPGAAFARSSTKRTTARPEVGKPWLSMARAASSPSPETAMARSSVIGLWPMTSSEPGPPLLADEAEIAGGVFAVERVEKQHPAGVGLAGQAFERFLGAPGVGAQGEVGNIAAGAHGRAHHFGIGAAGCVERTIEIAHAGQGPSGLGVPATDRACSPQPPMTCRSRKRTPRLAMRRAVAHNGRARRQITHESCREGFEPFAVEQRHRRSDRPLPGINNCVRRWPIALVQASGGEYIGAKIGVVG